MSARASFHHIPPETVPCDFRTMPAEQKTCPEIEGDSIVTASSRLRDLLTFHGWNVERSELGFYLADGRFVVPPAGLLKNNPRAFTLPPSIRYWLERHDLPADGAKLTRAYWLTREDPR